MNLSFLKTPCGAGTANLSQQFLKRSLGRLLSSETQALDADSGLDGLTLSRERMDSAEPGSENDFDVVLEPSPTTVVTRLVPTRRFNWA